jgi:hypothetical protein
MARHVFNVLHLLDADQLGRREFVYRGLGAWKKLPVANLRRHEEPPCLVDSYGIQSRPQQKGSGKAKAALQVDAMREERGQ